jgi:hypothetical protein
LVEVAIAKMRIAAFYQIQVVVCSGISRQQHKNAYLAHFWIHNVQFKKIFTTPTRKNLWCIWLLFEQLEWGCRSRAACFFVSIPEGERSAFCIPQRFV